MSKLKITKFQSLEAASDAAYKSSSNVGGRAFPISIFKQGNREFISTVFPIQYVVNELKTLPAIKDKGIRDVMKSMNRPIIPEHVKVTKEYILRNLNGNYILPPMTLNFMGQIDVYTIDLAAAHVMPGFMVVPYGMNFSMTDGQHRKQALEDLSKQNREDYLKIMNDGINVMIVVEDDLVQIHQDFADCSKTKPLPKSMIAVYDKRNPANSLVIDLINYCPLFKDKVDATATSLSKNSTKLILVSQIRSLLKELMSGNSSKGDIDFEIQATELFVDANSNIYASAFARYRDFINAITSKIDVLKTISELEGIDLNRIPNYRNTYLILNSAGLNIIGRIAYEIWQHDELKKNMNYYIDELSKIDWRKDAPMWKGNIVGQGSKGLKIATSNSTIKAAVALVKEKIGLSKQISELKKEVII